MSSLFEGPLSTQVVGAFRTVHRILGFGLLEGYTVNRKRIRRLMAILRIKVIYPGKTFQKGTTLTKSIPIC